LSHSNTAFHQLLKPISRHEFERLASEHHFGQKLRSATRWDQFTAMSMAQLSGRQSLRDIETNLLAQQDKLYHLGAKPIARSTLARINEKQPAELYQSLFYKLLGKTQNCPSNHKFRFKNPLYSLDASAIDLSLNICPWAEHRNDTSNVKLSVALNNGSQIPEFVAISDGNENDMIEGRKFDFPAGSMVAFDKGYIDYEWFADLTNKGTSFVTRLRSGSIFSVLEHLGSDADRGILSDERIELTSAHAKKRGAPELRLVRYIDQERGQLYHFLTNNFQLSARTIAAIYKDRWQVELFFKAIKQTLKIKNFAGYSKNAVLTQIWIAMIIYLLVSISKHSAKTGWTVLRIMRVFQMNLFERKTLKSLLQPDRSKRKHSEPQMRFAI